MADLKTLQNLLDARADKRLKDDLDKSFEGLSRWHYTSRHGREGLIEQMKSQLFDSHQRSYRESETAEFLASTDAMRQNLASQSGE